MCYTGWCIHEYAGDICRKPPGAKCPLEDNDTMFRHVVAYGGVSKTCLRKGAKPCPDMVGDEEAGHDCYQ